MSQVKWFVGIGWRVFDHHQRRIIRGSNNTVLLINMNVIQQFNPGGRSDSQVQETFDHIECSYRRLVSFQVFANLLCCLLRSFLRHAQERKNYQREVSLKFFLGFLQLHLCGRHVLSIQRFQSVDDGRYQFIFYIHDLKVFSGCKDTIFWRITRCICTDNKKGDTS